MQPCNHAMRMLARLQCRSADLKVLWDIPKVLLSFAAVKRFNILVMAIPITPQPVQQPKSWGRCDKYLDGSESQRFERIGACIAFVNVLTSG